MESNKNIDIVKTGEQKSVGNKTMDALVGDGYLVKPGDNVSRILMGLNQNEIGEINLDDEAKNIWPNNKLVLEGGVLYRIGAKEKIKIGTISNSAEYKAEEKEIKKQGIREETKKELLSLQELREKSVGDVRDYILSLLHSEGYKVQEGDLLSFLRTITNKNDKIKFIEPEASDLLPGDIIKIIDNFLVKIRNKKETNIGKIVSGFKTEARTNTIETREQLNLEFAINETLNNTDSLRETLKAYIKGVNKNDKLIKAWYQKTKNEVKELEARSNQMNPEQKSKKEQIINMMSSIEEMFKEKILNTEKPSRGFDKIETAEQLNLEFAINETLNNTDSLRETLKAYIKGVNKNDKLIKAWYQKTKNEVKELEARSSQMNPEQKSKKEQIINMMSSIEEMFKEKILNTEKPSRGFDKIETAEQLNLEFAINETLNNTDSLRETLKAYTKGVNKNDKLIKAWYQKTKNEVKELEARSSQMNPEQKSKKEQIINMMSSIEEMFKEKIEDTNSELDEIKEMIKNFDKTKENWFSIKTKLNTEKESKKITTSERLSYGNEKDVLKAVNQILDRHSKMLHSLQTVDFSLPTNKPLRDATETWFTLNNMEFEDLVTKFHDKIPNRLVEDHNTKVAKIETLMKIQGMDTNKIADKIAIR